MRFLFFLATTFACAASLCAQSASETLRRALLEQGNPEFGGNRVTLLPSAREKYDDMFAAIGDARTYVHLEYFIFRNDSVGASLLHLLHQKAREGVEVRLLVDGFGNWKAPHPMRRATLDSIRGLGIEVRIFDAPRFPYIQNMYHRDHRKIVVVDGLRAWTGGMNVADYYLHGTERTGRWRDMHVRLEGPVAGEFERIFQHIWSRGEQPLAEGLDAISRADSLPEPTGGEPEGVVVSVVNREPGKRSRRMRRAMVAALDAARHEVRIVNPYVTNTRAVSRAMKRAMRRGVSLRLMVPGRSDTRVTPDVMAVEMRKLMKRGAEVYYYDDGFHHSKTTTIDGEVACVGTTNLDGRSLRYDYEVSAFIFSPATAHELDSLFNQDLSHSEKLTKENYPRRFSLWHRMMGRLLRPVRNIF